MEVVVRVRSSEMAGYGGLSIHSGHFGERRRALRIPETRPEALRLTRVKGGAVRRSS